MRGAKLAGLFFVLPLLFTAAAVGERGARATPATPDGSEAHYLVFRIGADDAIEPVFHRIVTLASSPVSKSAGALAAARREIARGEPLVAIELSNARGEVVFRDVVAIPRWIRGEFHGEPLSGGGFTIESHRASQPDPAVVVRLPRLPYPPGAGDARLRVETRTYRSFDLASLAREATSLPLVSRVPQNPAIGTIGAFAPPADPANRLDFLVLGDGYRAVESAKFDADVQALADEYFDVTPYAEYRNFVNLTQLFTPSAQSGADHPPFSPECQPYDLSCCTDSVMSSDPLAGTFVSTALDARYCTAGIHRLLTVDYALTLAAAAAFPDWDEILVLVNDPTYGGAGGGFAVASTHPASVAVMQHEVGHSFTHLADEYDYPGTGSGCSEALGGCSANVTDETTRELIKWAPWILPATPVPTPEGMPAYQYSVGLFEGAQYTYTGIYRPRDHCLMQSLGVPFGEICAQEYVLTLYRGGWGVPAGGIDPLEPGTESPSPGAVDSSPAGLTFSVGLLEPIGGPALAVNWFVDGVLVDGETGSSFVFVPPRTGLMPVRVRAEDTTALVHPAMAGSTLRSARQWNVNVAQARLVVDKTGSGAGTVVSSPAGISCGADCTEDYAAETAVQLVATAASGSDFVGWEGHADCLDSSLTMNANKTCAARFEQRAPLTVAKAGSGDGRVTSSPAGINCGGSCQATWPPGALVQLDAIPDTGSEFSGWGGDPGCAGGIVTLLADTACSATFTPCSIDSKVTVSHKIISAEEPHEACNELVVGPSVTITKHGWARLRAGNVVRFIEPVEVLPGGELTVRIEPP